MRHAASSIPRFLLAACGWLAVGAVPAAGQSFTGTGPAPRLRMPSEAPVSPASGEPARPAAPSGVDLPPSIRFQGVPAGLRLGGEESTLTWPIFLTEAQARAARSLRVGYLSAISVAPESSSLTVTVNGTVVGRTAIRAPGAIKILELDFPDGLLRPGYNAVRLSATQRHRVDCSLGATHELWTQIDPTRTGLVLAAPAPIAQSLDDLMAVPPDQFGRIPISVILGGKPDLAILGRLFDIVQAVVLAGRFQHPVVRFGAPPANASGLILAIGEQAMKSLGVEATSVEAGGRLRFVPAREDRAAVLAVRAETADEMRAVAGALHPPSTLKGAEPGVQAARLADGFRIEGQTTVSLAELGFASRDSTARLPRAGFDLALPQDFLAADYARAVLTLKGGYASGLAPGAQVVVNLNGRNASSVRLPRAGGDLFREVEVQLPLSRWRPGLNELEIAAEVPTASDAACDTSRPPENRERFLLLDSTSLRFPTFARALRIPDLAAMTSGGSAYGLENAQPRLVLPLPDADSVSAAATLVARMATAARHVIRFEVSTTRQVAEGATLVVAPIRALDPGTVESLGLAPDQVKAVWQARAEATSAPVTRFSVEGGLGLDALRRNVPSSCAQQPRLVHSASLDPRSGGARRADGAVTASEWKGLQIRSSAWDRFREAAEAFGTQVTAAVARLLGYARASVANEAVELPPGAGLLVGQSLAGSDRRQLLTVVAAPTAETLHAGVTCLVDPSMWKRLDGSLAFLDMAEGWLRTVPASSLALIATDDDSIGNARLVAAGWLSLNVWAYVGFTLGAAVCLGWTTTNLVRQVGRRNP